MSEIYKLVQAIESYNESDLCLGTLRSLKKIKDAAAMLETELADKYKQLAEAQAEIERKNAIIERMQDALRLAFSEARSTHCEQTILAALAAERTEK